MDVLTEPKQFTPGTQKIEIIDLKFTTIEWKIKKEPQIYANIWNNDIELKNYGWVCEAEKRVGGCDFERSQRTYFSSKGIREHENLNRKIEGK